MHKYCIDGAGHDVPKGDTPVPPPPREGGAGGLRPARDPRRDGKWAAVVLGADGDPSRAGEMRDWCVGYWDAIHPYSAGGGYVNFMGEGDAGQERVQATYRDNYDRLTRVKAQYDPQNVFRVNQNIRPAAA